MALQETAAGQEGELSLDEDEVVERQRQPERQHYEHETAAATAVLVGLLRLRPGVHEMFCASVNQNTGPARTSRFSNVICN